MSKQLSANKLALNLDKRNIITFLMNNLLQHTLSVAYNEKYIEDSKYRVFWSAN
jgi:hypothetical protein